MNENLFQNISLSEISFFQKLFKQFPQENAVIELNNLLASNPILNISENDIAEIEKNYNLSLLKEFKLNLEEFYAVYLNFCLGDKILNDDEFKKLNHLKHLLNLDSKTIEKIHAKIGEIIYKKTFQEVVADGKLTEQEKDFLVKIENTLKLPKELTDKISSEIRINFIENYVAQIVTDQRLSPTEEQELQAIASNLNVNVQLNDETKEQLYKLKIYWALENLDLPVIQPDITTQKAELCHFKTSDVSWYELRSVRQRVSYSGYSTSFKVAKGFYLRSGNYRPESFSADSMKLIDKGTIYLTNKRIVFTGTSKNSIIRIDKILNFTPYSDAVEIGKETGKSPIIKMNKDADIFCMMLERLLNER